MSQDLGCGMDLVLGIQSLIQVITIISTTTIQPVVSFLTCSLPASVTISSRLPWCSVLHSAVDALLHLLVFHGAIRDSRLLGRTHELVE
jgi:hypothetical protein